MERRFARQARITTVLAGASGLYMVLGLALLTIAGAVAGVQGINLLRW